MDSETRGKRSMSSHSKIDIRIYYGVLEQAVHYIKPTIENIQGIGNISLVRLRQVRKPNLRNIIEGILVWKNPDILITAVDNVSKKEIPLFMIEFSAAVFTKDHELQRFDSYIPLIYYKNFIHIKISGKKESSGEMGGDINFDANLPFALLSQKQKVIGHWFEWKTVKGQPTILDIDNDHPSCPKPINEFFDLISKGITSYLKDQGNWLNHMSANYEPHNERRIFLNDMKLEDITTLDTSRCSYHPHHNVSDRNSLVIKFNRFTHAMDPERGMLVYYGLLSDHIITKFIMSAKSDEWYKNNGNASKSISEYIKKHKFETPYDYAECFMLATNTKEIFSGTLHQNIGKTVNIDDVVRQNFWQFSKGLKIIFSFSDMIIIYDKNGKEGLILKFTKITPNLESDYSITPLNDAAYNEDDLTYVIVHNVLKDNGYDILNVSYPGAQGDRAILIQAGTGRSQDRQFIDIIAIKDNILTLTENKCSINKVDDDVEKLKKYKTSDRIPPIKEFLRRYRGHKERPCIKIGIGFISDKEDLASIKKLDELDYYISVNMKKETWQIWHSDFIAIFSKTKGSISLQDIYRPNFNVST